jgi:hypothetical protein
LTAPNFHDLAVQRKARRAPTPSSWQRSINSPNSSGEPKRLVGATIGVIAEHEFERARAAISELAGYHDYEDWLDSRRGLQFGLAIAGVDANIVVVGLSSFPERRPLAGTSPDERALDAFASVAQAVRGAAEPRALPPDRDRRILGRGGEVGRTIC